MSAKSPRQHALPQTQIFRGFPAEEAAEDSSLGLHASLWKPQILQHGERARPPVTLDPQSPERAFAAHSVAEEVLNEDPHLADLEEDEEDIRMPVSGSHSAGVASTTALTPPGVGIFAGLGTRPCGNTAAAPTELESVAAARHGLAPGTLGLNPTAPEWFPPSRPAPGLAPPANTEEAPSARAGEAKVSDGSRRAPDFRDGGRADSPPAVPPGAVSVGAAVAAAEAAAAVGPMSANASGLATAGFAPGRTGLLDLDIDHPPEVLKTEIRRQRQEIISLRAALARAEAMPHRWGDGPRSNFVAVSR